MIISPDKVNKRYVIETSVELPQVVNEVYHIISSHYNTEKRTFIYQLPVFEPNLQNLIDYILTCEANS